MALLRKQPNVQARARRGDEEGLVAAAGYQDLVSDPDGGMIDRGAEIRRQAILALGTVGHEAGGEAVEAALSDPSEEVRLAAIGVLHAWEKAEPLAAALPWLPRDPRRSRDRALRALEQLRQPASALTLTAALTQAPDHEVIEDDESRLLKLLVEADESSNVAGPVVDQLLVALASERPATSDRAEALLAVLAPLSIESVLAELNAGPAPHRSAAVLARIKDRRAVRPLMEGLGHHDPRVRAECARALAELQDPLAVNVLVDATRDPDYRVRASAWTALDRLGTVARIHSVATILEAAILETIRFPEIGRA
jgi:HEAT repeat protein